MRKNFVPFELAVKLKELGFNEECIAFYTQNAYGSLSQKLQYFVEPIEDVNSDFVFVAAPLWEQAYQYLFEKSGKYIIPIPCDDENIGKWYASGKPYQTYEEARLACLQELIKIVETWNTQKK